MRPFYCIMLAAFLTGGPAAAPAARAAPAEEAPVVYVIPIRGMIEPALLYVIRRGTQEAVLQRAKAVVFVLDTPGGTVKAAEEIVQTIRHLSLPTYAFVEHNAISAGAIIALATDHIYMAPGSKIGDAMPIMMSPLGGAQEMPEGVEEKTVSYVAGLIRATAQDKGHDDRLAECMVRRELEYKIGDTVISPAGQLLTLTNKEAERRYGPDQEPLLSSGTVDNVEALLDRIGLGRARTRELTVTASERIARFIAALAPLFLMAGLVGIYIEIRTPGFGLPGLLGALSLAVFFWGHHIAGLAGMEDVVIFFVGVAFLLVEIFLIPDFGVIGITGITLMLWALLKAMVHQVPGGPILPSWPDMEVPLLKLFAALIGSVALALLAGRFLPRTPLFRKLMLAGSTSTAEGYSAGADRASMIGLTGRTASSLRPGGTAVFEGRRYSVVTHGDFIDADTPVRVVDTHGNRIVVEPHQQGEE